MTHELALQHASVFVDSFCNSCFSTSLSSCSQLSANSWNHVSVSNATAMQGSSSDSMHGTPQHAQHTSAANQRPSDQLQQLLLTQAARTEDLSLFYLSMHQSATRSTLGLCRATPELQNEVLLLGSFHSSCFSTCLGSCSLLLADGFSSGFVLHLEHLQSSFHLGFFSLDLLPLLAIGL